MKFNLTNPNSQEAYHDAEFDIPSKALVSKLSAICPVELSIGKSILQNNMKPKIKKSHKKHFQAENS